MSDGSGRQPARTWPGVARARPGPRRTRARPGPGPGKGWAGPGSAKGRPRLGRAVPGPCPRNPMAIIAIGRPARPGPAKPTAFIAVRRRGEGFFAKFFLQKPSQFNPNDYYSCWGVFVIFCKYPLAGKCLFCWLFCKKFAKKLLLSSSINTSTFLLYFL